MVAAIAIKFGLRVFFEAGGRVALHDLLPGHDDDAGTGLIGIADGHPLQNLFSLLSHSITEHSDSTKAVLDYRSNICFGIFRNLPGSLIFGIYK
jgi:hypothetical protein